MSSSYTGPNSPYGEPRDNGWTWNPGAGELFSQQNSFDPTTGAPVGPGSLPPHTIALPWQAEHNRRVWNYQQNLMKSAHGYASGALGLLQSFRPGGSSAIEAGQYNTLAQIQLNRAQMTQPLDLTGDYVRETNSRARMASNRQAERTLAVQAAAALASVAGAAFTGGASLAMLPGLIGGLAGAAGGGQQGAQGGPMTAGVPPQGRAAASGPTSIGPAGAPVGQQQGGGQQAGPMTSGSPPAMGGSGGGAQTSGAPQALPSTLAPDQGGGAAPGGPGGQQGAQGGGGAGMAGGMGGGGVGANGDFSSLAYGANAAAGGGGDPIRHLALSRMLATTVESDPIWQRLQVGVDQRLAERLSAA